MAGWVIDMENTLLESASASNPSEEEKRWKKPSIFRLPYFVRMMKPEVFTPRVVALGSYHHHEEHLRPLEVHKDRALLHLLRRSGKPLGAFVRAMDAVIEELQVSYDGLSEEWMDKDRFIKLMIVDGCFMLEVMRLDSNNSGGYVPSDPFFGPHASQHKVPYMRRDMLMLENQLPLLVLNKLVAVEKDLTEEAAEAGNNDLLLKFFLPTIPIPDNSFKKFITSVHAFHPVDLFRRIKLVDSATISAASPLVNYQHCSPPAAASFAVMRTAVELHEAGVRFALGHSPSLTSSFFDRHSGLLTLPHITVDDTTECELLNMVALEHLHSSTGGEVSSYVVFMDSLVDSAKDVQRRHLHGIMDNGLGSDKDLARLFNCISKEVIIEQGGTLGSMQVEVESYCRKSWKITAAVFF